MKAIILFFFSISIQAHNDVFSCIYHNEEMSFPYFMMEIIKHGNTVNLIHRIPDSAEYDGITCDKVESEQRNEFVIVCDGRTEDETLTYKIKTSGSGILISSQDGPLTNFSCKKETIH